MQKFLSLLFSRRALAVVGVVMLALLVWFIGPLVAFDTLHPLASVGSRVVTIGSVTDVSRTVAGELVDEHHWRDGSVHGYRLCLTVAGLR